MRILLATLLVAGCSFEHGTLGAQPDAVGGTIGPGELDGAPAIAVACKFPDAALSLCLEFEDREYVPIVHDASLFRVDAVAANIAETKHADSYAAHIETNSDLDVPEAPNLDLPGPFTIEMWAMSSSLQFGPLVRNAGQYNVMLDTLGNVSCAISNSEFVIAPIPGKLSSWTHIACTYDRDRLRIWINGSVVKCTTTGDVTLSTLGMSGTNFVSSYIGEIDDIRIYSRAFSAGEMCTHSQHSDCTDECSG